MLGIVIVALMGFLALLYVALTLVSRRRLPEERVRVPNYEKQSSFFGNGGIWRIAVYPDFLVVAIPIARRIDYADIERVVVAPYPIGRTEVTVVAGKASYLGSVTMVRGAEENLVNALVKYLDARVKRQ